MPDSPIYSTKLSTLTFKASDLHKLFSGLAPDIAGSHFALMLHSAEHGPLPASYICSQLGGRHARVWAAIRSLWTRTPDGFTCGMVEAIRADAGTRHARATRAGIASAQARRSQRAFVDLQGRRHAPATYQVLYALARSIDASGVTLTIDELKTRASAANMSWDHDLELPHKVMRAFERPGVRLVKGGAR